MARAPETLRQMIRRSKQTTPPARNHTPPYEALWESLFHNHALSAQRKLGHTKPPFVCLTLQYFFAPKGAKDPPATNPLRAPNPQTLNQSLSILNPKPKTPNPKAPSTPQTLGPKPKTDTLNSIVYSITHFFLRAP